MQLFQLDDRANFDGALARARNATGDGDGFVEILDVDQEESAELLARFRKGAVGDRAFAFADADAGGRGNRLEWRSRHELPSGLQLTRQIARFAVAALALGFG